MSVDLNDIPPERAPPVWERIQPVGVLRASALLESVAVDDCRQVSKALLGSSHRGLPVAALLELAVAEDDEDVSVEALEPQTEGAAHPDGESVAERAGVGLDAGDLGAVRVAVQGRLGSVEGGELVRTDEAGPREDGVERLR